MKNFNTRTFAGLFIILFIMAGSINSNLMACHPGFSWTQTANNTITFTDTTSGLDANKHFYWGFGDTHTSTTENPVHYFTVPGTYYVCMHVTDSTVTCSGYFCDSITVTGVNCNNLSLTVTAVSASCHTCTDGSAVANVTGGTTPYNYLWSPSGATTNYETGLHPGTFSVCVTDANGCTACNNFNIGDTIVCNLSLAAYQYHYATCSTCSDASAHAYVTGGTTPYTYLWTPSNDTSQFLLSVTPGTYTVCVTDANHCTACTTVHLIDSIVCNMTISAYAYLNASCSTCADGVAHAGATGGTSPYSYIWSPGGATGNVASGLLSGTYTVCATDAHNCTACTTVTITDSSACHVYFYYAYGINASCATCSDGGAHTYATGGTTPYSYLWSPGGQTTSSLTGLTPGTYTVCVTDAHNCNTCTTVIVGDTVVCNLTVGAYQYHPASCSTCGNGVAHSYATGGTAPYHYLWSPSGGTNSNATGLNPGTYTVCVTDAHNCTACTTVIIGDTSTTSGCQAYFYLYPDTTQLHHYNCINYASGTAPFTYNWAWGDATYSSGSNPSHTYANAGVYTICLQITDATGCTSHFCRTDSMVRTKNTMIYVNVLMPETGIQEISINSNWMVYPNPANSMLIIHSQTQNFNSLLVIKNVLGEELYKVNITNSDTPIDVSKWSNGVYFYQIKGSENSIQGKFMKQ